MTFQIDIQSPDSPRWTPLGSVQSEPVARQLAEMALARLFAPGRPS